MLADISYLLALVASLLWYGAAFRYWSFQHRASSKLFVPHAQRESPVFPTITALVRFLGGMNGALALLSLALLIVLVGQFALFSAPAERALLLLVLGAGHLSQFAFNIPVLRNGGRQNDSYWDVLSGPMRFIFFMDAAQMGLCFAAVGLQFT